MALSLFYGGLESLIGSPQVIALDYDLMALSLFYGGLESLIGSPQVIALDGS